MTSLSLFQITATALLNAGSAWLVGVFLCQGWVNRVSPAWRTHAQRRLSLTVLPAIFLCLLGTAGNLWATAAVMSDTTLLQAGEGFVQMIASTSIGHFGLMGIGILATLLAINLPRRDVHSSKRKWFISGLMLALFAYARAGSSHAAEHGLFTLPMLSEWVHLLSMSTWVGVVLASGWILLPLAVPTVASDLDATEKILHAISSSATIALVGLFATGLYNGYRGLGTIDNLVGNSYGTTLLIKLAFVFAAIVLGGYNRFVGFPAIGRSAITNEPLHTAMYRAITVLHLESFLLMGAVIAAAMLVGMAPPGFV